MPRNNNESWSNNSICIAKIVMLTMLAAMLCANASADQSYQRIEYSNIQINSITSTINTTWLGLQESYTIDSHNESELLFINAKNISYDINYSCRLNESGSSYVNTGAFNATDSEVIINTQLDNPINTTTYISFECIYDIYFSEAMTNITVNTTDNSTYKEINITASTRQSYSVDEWLQVIDMSPPGISIAIYVDGLMQQHYNLSTNHTVTPPHSNNTNNSQYNNNASNNDSSNNESNYHNSTSTSFFNGYKEYYSYRINNTTTQANITLEIAITEENSRYCILNNESAQLLSFNESLNITLPAEAGNHSYNISCQDIAVNTAYTTLDIEILIDTVVPAVYPIFFNIILSKPSYNLGEIGYYIINANNHSNVSITICPVAEGWVQCYLMPEFIDDTYPKQQAMPYSNKTGIYTIEGIMKYKNTSIRFNTTFNIINTITATITSSERKAAAGSIITFNASASGGIPPYGYKWLLFDNQEFIGPGAYKNFTIPGSYKINLTVNDSQGNMYKTSKEIDIIGYYTLKVITYDKATSSRLSGVMIEAKNNGESHNVTTNNAGEASIKLLEGRYDLYASKADYGVLVEDVKLDENLTLNLNMSYEDFEKPIITLLTSDDESFAKESVKLKFKVDDKARLYCELFVAQQNDSWFELKDYGNDLLTNTEYSFELTDLDIGAYKWKISCSDKQSNTATTHARRFIVSDQAVSKGIEHNADTQYGINEALDKIYSLSGNEAEVVDILEIKKSLKIILDKSSSLDRDIYNLVYRKDLDEQGKADMQRQYITAVEDLKKKTPIDVKVDAHKNFVKYVKQEDLKPLLETYKSLKNLNVNMNAFLEWVKRIQSRAVINTKAMNVVLYYDDGSSNEITLIVKDISIRDFEDGQSLNANGVTFVESIPKSIVSDARFINFVTKDYSILKSDPLIEFPASTKRIIYYINDTIPLDRIQDTDTVLIDKNINIEQSITGFSIFGLGSLKEVSFSSQGVLIIIIMLLIIIYLVINFDLIYKIKGLFAGVKKKVSYIRVLINDSNDHLDIADYNKAALIYREIKLNYEASNEAVQKAVYDECYELCNRLDIFYFNELYTQAEDVFIAGKKPIEIYDKMVMTYDKIDDRYKKELEKKLKTIKNRI